MIQPALNPDSCRIRQKRLIDVLRTQNLHAALLTDPRHVHYFTGYWAYRVLPPALLLTTEGEAILCMAEEKANLATDRVLYYPAQRLATLQDDRLQIALKVLLPDIQKYFSIGVDRAVKLYRENIQWHDLMPGLYQLRRPKDADEIEMIRHAVSACEAGYAAVRKVLSPGVNELEIYGTMLSAATIAAGEPIGEMGNDCQSGTPGGQPRIRSAQDGELFPLDITVIYRGYCCDLTRTFAVNRKPSNLQLEAFSLIRNGLQEFETMAQPGVSCEKLYTTIFEKLNGINGWSFPHHLGHGIGLDPHEAPRLNPNWDDTLQEGDVIAVEPGLYGEALKGGIRIEENYLVTENGLEKLSSFPIEF
ncbi:MAG: Xaa-Pro peptidase family protein [Abditibacteriaceae bacterium]